MVPDPVTLGLLVALGLLLGAAGGCLDAPAATTAAVAARAVPPRAAVALAAGAAAVGAVVGALLGDPVARTLAALAAPPPGGGGLLLVLAALLGALGWVVVAAWRGWPCSTSLALAGGLLGAALASSAPVAWGRVVTLVLAPALVVPALGLVLAHAGVLAVLWALRHTNPAPVFRRLRRARVATSAAVALGHGLQGAQAVTGAVLLALVAARPPAGGGAGGAPAWLVVGAAAAVAAGTALGARRALLAPRRGAGAAGRAAGRAPSGARRVGGPTPSPSDPVHAVTAELVAAVLVVAAATARAPVSAPHALAAATVGAGTVRGRAGVRWGPALRTGVAGLLTLPAPAALATACALLLGA